MNALPRSLFSRAVGVTLLAFALPAIALAETAPRITQRIDDAHRVTLTGNTPPQAKVKYDTGAVSPDTAAGRIEMVLKRSSAQEAALRALITAQHTPGSANFHKWLTPEEFGRQFGPADSDLQAITAWLQGKGFNVAGPNKGRTTIEFSGTAGQVKAAFHTELHTYVRKGVTFHANNGDPSIPAALAPVVAGFASLNDIKPASDLKVLGEATFDPKTHKAKPQWNEPYCDQSTYPTYPCTFYTPTPADMAVQYNLGSVYSAGTNGAGEHIGILSASNVDLSNFNNYRSTFGLSAQTPNVVIDGYDPGQNGAATEAYLDVEASGAMAPGANVMLYVGGDTITTSGFSLAIVRAINDNLADTMSLSYGTCEQQLGLSGNLFFLYAWQQAAAQGQSVFVSAGDGGSAGCDDFDTESAAQDGLAVSGFASTEFNTAVGGTDFYYSTYQDGYFSQAFQNQLASYWGTSTSNNPEATLITPVPEQPWNDSLGLNLPDFSENGTNIVAGSGGKSSCVFGSGDDGDGGYTSCIAGYGKPAWQTGPGVPNDGVRDIPDVSLFAANGVNLSSWPICAGPYDCTAYNTGYGPALNVTLVGGTSASSPAMAGIMAVVDQSQKGRQGNANFYLYPLATQFPNSFNDITIGSNNVVCVQGSPDCSLDTDGDGYYSLQEYPAGPGYDLASGLGSINGANLIANWGKLTFTGSSTTLSMTPTTTTHGTAITATATVSASTGTATGSVALVTASTLPGQAGQGTIALSDGTGSSTFNYLPGGTYNVTGVYSGDGTVASSTSSPVSVTIAPENSTTVLQLQGLDVNFNYYNLSQGGSYPYGSQIYVDADIAGTSGVGTATGSVQVKDNGNAVATVNVNSGSVAEAQISTFTPGAHSVTAAYAGDASFNASTSVPFTFTITKGTPQIYSEDSSDDVPVYAGEAFQVPFVVVGTSIGGAPPSGSAVVTLGTYSQTVATLTTGIGFGQAVGSGTVTFTNLAAGTYPLTISYSGDSNYAATTVSPKTITVQPLAGLTPTTTTVSTSNSSGVGPQGTLNLNATVAGTGGVPGGSVYFYANGLYLGGSTLDQTGNTSLQVFYPSVFTGNNSITAQYAGDGTFAPSISTAIAVSGNLGDFAITAAAQSVSIPSTSHTANTSATLMSLSGLGGTVNLTCTTSNPLVLCLPAANSYTLPTDGSQVTVAVSLYSVTLKTSSQTSHGPLKKWLEGGSIVFACLFCFFPARRRITVKVLMLLVATGLAAGAMGCGASSPIAGNGVQYAPSGNYTATLTANASGVTHAVTLNVTVQ